MSEEYTKLFKQLYQQRFCISQLPSNSIQRVRLLQRKIKEAKNSSRLSEEGKLSFNGPLEDTRDYLESPGKILRFQDPKPKSTQRSKLIKNLSDNPNMKQLEDLPTKTYRRNSFSYHKSRPINSNLLYYEKQFTVVKETKPLNFTLDLKVKRNVSTGQPKYSSNYNQLIGKQAAVVRSRVRTPSKQVFINGHNLEEEGQTHMMKARQLDRQIDQYHKQIEKISKQHLGNLSRRRKTSRYEKYRVESKASARAKLVIKNQPKQAGKTQRNSKAIEKQENIELLPWSMMPEHEFF